MLIIIATLATAEASAGAVAKADQKQFNLDFLLQVRDRYSTFDQTDNSLNYKGKNEENQY